MSVISPIIREPITLESGDHLSRAEFEWRYQAMPQLKRAELIEGVVYVASPVRIRQHSEPHADIITRLGRLFGLIPNCFHYKTAPNLS